MNDLLPCPFCGGEDVGWDWRCAYSIDSSYAFFGCRGCGMGSDTASEDNTMDPEDIAAWNRRALPAASQPEDPCCHEWYQGRCVHCEISVKDFRALPAASQPEAEPVAFQARVKPWMQACFGPEISADRLERGDRLLEEVFELLQSGDYPQDRVAALTGYVWSRPAGEPAQEVGGVMVTLAAYCLAHGLDMHEAAETELARIWTKIEKIRAKQKAKPTGSALPQEWAIPAPVATAEGLDALIADAELAIRVMAETGTFETGQGIIRDMINMLTAQQAEIETLRAKLAEAEADADRLASLVGQCADANAGAGALPSCTCFDCRAARALTAHQKRRAG